MGAVANPFYGLRGQLRAAGDCLHTIQTGIHASTT
jgi:hypothetical protein